MMRCAIAPPMSPRPRKDHLDNIYLTHADYHASVFSVRGRHLDHAEQGCQAIQAIYAERMGDLADIFRDMLQHIAALELAASPKVRNPPIRSDPEIACLVTGITAFDHTSHPAIRSAHPTGTME
jgi:hypothetical protein